MKSATYQKNACRVLSGIYATLLFISRQIKEREKKKERRIDQQMTCHLSFWNIYFVVSLPIKYKSASVGCCQRF